MVIFVDEQIPLLYDSLAQIGEVVQFSGRSLTKEMLSNFNCEILFVRSTTKVNKDLLEGTKVKFVGTATSGIDHIDVEYLNERCIYFADASGSNSNSVAEYVIFSILHWAKDHNFDLRGMPIGIIGFGNIGKLVGKYANLLGMEVIINDPPLLEKIEKGFHESFPDYVKYANLNELLLSSRVVTNHVPLEKQGKYPTYKLLDSNNLELLGQNTLFIHTSRGGVVVERDLITIKRMKELTLAIDVWENEPHINVELAKECEIATPHIAGYSYDGKLRGTLKMLEEFEKFTNIKPDYSLVISKLSEYKPLDAQFYQTNEYIYKKLLESRKLLEDTAVFKKIVEIRNESERARYFDELRKNYPRRREIL